MRYVLTILLTTGLLGPAAMSDAAAQTRGRTAVETILGGSFFPFRRSFPPPSARCRKLADDLKDRHNDGFLTSHDLQELRRKGCGGAM